MIQSDATPNRPRLTGVLFAVSVALILGAVSSASYSLYWFIRAQTETSRLESQLRARQQLGNREAEGVRMTIGILSGIGPVGMDLAAAAAILEMQKQAWKYLSVAFLLGFGGFLLCWHIGGNRLTAGTMASFFARRVTRRVITSIGLSGLLVLLTLVVLYVWPGFLRPLPRYGVAPSGNLDYILSRVHIEAIHVGMTIDDVQATLDVGQENCPLAPWVTQKSEARQLDKQLGEGNVRLFQLAKKDLPEHGEFWFELSGPGQHAISLKMRDGRVVDKVVSWDELQTQREQGR